jgi:hypothetical protein
MPKLNTPIVKTLGVIVDDPFLSLINRALA